MTQQLLTMINQLTLARLEAGIDERENLPYKISELLPQNQKQEREAAEQFYRETVDRERKQGHIVPFERLCQICDYHPMAKRMLELALAEYSYPQLKEYFRWLGLAEGVSLELVQQLFWEKEEEQPDIYEQKEAYKQVSKILKSTQNGELFSRRIFSMDERIYQYLLGDNQPEQSLCFFINPEIFKGSLPLWIHESQAKEMEEYLLQGVKLFHLRGEQGNGKRHLIRYLCQQYNFPLLEINGKLLGHLEFPELKEAVWGLKREMLLRESALCIYNIKEFSQTEKGWETCYLLKEVIEPLLDTDYPVFICSDKGSNLVMETEGFIGQLILEPLNRQERYALWKGFAKVWGLRDLQEEILSSKFRLNAKEIKKVASRLAFRQEREELTEEIIHQECMLLMKDNAMGNLKSEKTPQTLEELKLPQTQKDIIRHIVSHITYRYQVYDQWKLEKKYPYGKTVSALFTGPPGTGKTMAAHVIANML
ncbi:MAG: hypothetical protein IKW28_10840, partial [Lachnospiraceae bacterium]|nr:hypothetical protein [Lachnospiraceae bacterium]